MKAALESIGGVVRRAIAKGVRIGVGTDAGVYPHGRNFEELHLLTDLGMALLEALRAATSVDADLLGDSGIGTLAAGKLADVVAFPGDPRQDIRQVEQVFFVMKDGSIVRDNRSRR